MEVTRKYLRYDVLDTQVMRGELEGVQWPFKISTFSEGGCGFHCPVKISDLEKMPRVFCSFVMLENPDNSLRVGGQLLYIREIEIRHRKTFLYGIQFLSSIPRTSSPIFSSLEELLKNGKIRPA